MKMYVKRDDGIFEKGKIELEKISEWKIVYICLERELKRIEEKIKFYSRHKYEDRKRDLERLKENKQQLQEMIHVLEYGNELKWLIKKDSKQGNTSVWN
ncbi:MAG: hypothetical protein ACQEWW_26470 [Bacillota bacterium]